jgi:uncharacterized protein YabN with tetrapyrrole methylase and pyrophosphatase domain
MPDSNDKPYSPGIGAIFEVVARLRAPGGCPWDREQTHESLRPYLLEETYELLEAIDSGNDSKMKEELGDLLLQVAMHAEIAAEEGRFDAAQVSEAVAAKMVARHPHVFGTTSVADAEEVLRNWEHQKVHEARKAGNDESVVDRVPGTLPALAWALGLQKRAARVGFDFTSEQGAVESVARAGSRKRRAAGLPGDGRPALRHGLVGPAAEGQSRGRVASRGPEVSGSLCQSRGVVARRGQDVPRPGAGRTRQALGRNQIARGRLL